MLPGLLTSCRCQLCNIIIIMMMDCIYVNILALTVIFTLKPFSLGDSRTLIFKLMLTLAQESQFLKKFVL